MRAVPRRVPALVLDQAALEGLRGGALLPEEPERAAEPLERLRPGAVGLRALGGERQAGRSRRIARRGLGLAQLGQERGPLLAGGLLVERAAQIGDAPLGCGPPPVPSGPRRGAR